MSSYSVSNVIILSVLCIYTVLFTAYVYLLLYHVSSLSPNLPLAVQLGLFEHLQNLNSWFLYQILLVARHMLYWHAQDNLASQILASFPGSRAGPCTRAWERGYTNHEFMWHQENKSPCIYLQQFTLTGTVLKVFNLVQNHAGTIPKQYNM